MSSCVNLWYVPFITVGIKWYSFNYESLVFRNRSPCINPSAPIKYGPEKDYQKEKINRGGVTMEPLKFSKYIEDLVA